MRGPPIAIPYELREKLQDGLSSCKIIFLSAGPGWGKTAATCSLLEKQTVSFLSLRRRPLPGFFSKERLIVLDDFQALPPQAEEKLRELLRKSPQGQRFILLSRGPLPEYLSFYEAAGALLTLGSGDLALDTDSLARLAQARGLSLSPYELRRLRDETEGRPAAVQLLLSLLSAGQPLRRQAIDALDGKMGAYLEESALRLLAPEARGLLVRLSPFDPLPLALAEAVTGDSAVLSALENLRRTSGLLQRTGDVWRVSDRRFLLPYLQKRLREEYSPEEIRSLHLAAGRWYALGQDGSRALFHLQQAGSRRDILDALTRSARLQLQTGSYDAVRDYCHLLTEEEIRRSPDLLCAMSLLHSASSRPEEAEIWYERLQEFIRRMDRRDGDYPRVRGLAACLDIALPHRGTSGLADVLPAVYQQLLSKSLTLPEWNVTDSLPSLLRGGKDFSRWVPEDEALYRALRVPVEAVLGRAGVGAGELALTESLLEKGGDISGRFLALTALREELRVRGAPEMEFVLIALLVRALSAAGNPGRARELLLQFRAEAAEKGAGGLLPNIDAMRCRLSLLEDGGFSDRWFADHAPDEERFCGRERYRCLTKVRCYLKHGDCLAALLLLGRLLDDAQRYDRPLDRLETLILVAICRYRMDQADWRTYFSDALALGAAYGYVAVFAREGAALLPLLERRGRETVEAGYWDRILSGAVTQAGYYGRYLQPLDSPLGRLTQTERTVLRLLCQNRSNEEICSLLHIKLPTAKTHVRNVFKKLAVSSRAEARTAARRLGLVRTDAPQP